MCVGFRTNIVSTLAPEGKWHMYMHCIFGFRIAITGNLTTAPYASLSISLYKKTAEKCASSPRWSVESWIQDFIAKINSSKVDFIP